MYSRTSKVLGGIQYTMNSSKTQVNKKLRSMNKRLDNLNKRLTNNAPVAISTKKGSAGKDYYRTTGRERISSVTALNQSFNLVDVFVNPGNSSLFPWLSGIGNKYDLYHFKKLKFIYVPALPTSEEGNVYLGLDYNTLDPIPASSNELCQLSHWTMNVVWKPNNLVIDLNNIGWLYTRSGPVANADYKTYDLGKVFVAVEGISYTGTIGYVEVEYDVEFKRRQPDYTNSIIPVPDIWTPMGFVYISSLAGGARSSIFGSNSASNNSLLQIDQLTGTITVNQQCRAMLYGTAIRSGQDYITGIDLVGSTDGITFTTVSSTGVNLVTLSPGYQYKIYNDNANAAEMQMSIFLFDK